MPARPDEDLIRVKTLVRLVSSKSLWQRNSEILIFSLISVETI
jgi:hypothetical protein